MYLCSKELELIKDRRQVPQTNNGGAVLALRDGQR